MSFDLPQAGRYLTRLVSRARMRRFRIDLIEGLLEASFCLSFLLAAFFLLDRVRLELWPRGGCLSAGGWILTSVGVAALLSLAYGLVRAWWRVPSAAMAAKELDDAFGLADRVGTAIEVVEGRAAGRLGPMAVADTVRCVQELDLGKAYPLPAAGYRFLAALALGVTIWLAWLPLPSPSVPGLSAEDEARLASAPGGSGEDPYVHFDTLPDDPKIQDPNRWNDHKVPNPPYAKEKPPKKDPPSKLPNPDVSQQPQPNEGDGGGGGGGEGGGGGSGGGGGGNAPKQPQPADPQKGQPPPPSGGKDAGGNAPGKGHPELYGPKERIPSQFLPKEVKPLLGQGKGREKEMDIDEGTGDPSSGGSDSSGPKDFPTLRQKYSKLNESALSPEHVSPEDRKLVEDYFNAIQTPR